jgi:hypothetical protein
MSSALETYTPFKNLSRASYLSAAGGLYCLVLAGLIERGASFRTWLILTLVYCGLSAILLFCLRDYLSQFMPRRRESELVSRKLEELNRELAAIRREVDRLKMDLNLASEAAKDLKVSQARLLRVTRRRTKYRSARQPTPGHNS